MGPGRPRSCSSDRSEGACWRCGEYQTFLPQPPVLLFTSNRLAMGQYYRGWDVDEAGRFLIMANGIGDATQLEVIFNWVQELERLEDGTGSRSR